MKLLIHHHAAVFRENGSYWVTSSIGAWVQELTKHFSQVGLLFQESSVKHPYQDFLITALNVTFHGLGTFSPSERKQRNKFIRQSCRNIGDGYDVLLIRGITPRQLMVYKNCETPVKVFLLVGSLIDSRPKFAFTRMGLILWSFYWKRIIELKMISKKSLFFANSPSTVKELYDFLKITASFVPTNTITKNEFIPFEFRGVKSEPTALFCARVIKDKGIEELILAISYLKKDGIKVMLDIVGKVDPDYQKQLEIISKSSLVENQIRFYGHIGFGAELLIFFRTADIYILPSWHEGFPKTIWEASCSCTPIIVTKVGGIPGLISENEALFIPAKNPKAIAACIYKFINDQKLAENLVFNAYENAKKYSLEICIDIFNLSIKNK